VINHSTNILDAIAFATATARASGQTTLSAFLDAVVIGYITVIARTGMLASALARSSAQTSFSAVLKAVVIVDHIMTASIAFTVCHPTVHILPNDSANNLRPASNIFVVEFILEHSFAHFPNEFSLPPNVFV
jgi:hypothetical protein